MGPPVSRSCMPLLNLVDVRKMCMMWSHEVTLLCHEVHLGVVRTIWCDLTAGKKVISVSIVENTANHKTLVSLKRKVAGI